MTMISLYCLKSRIFKSMNKMKIMKNLQSKMTAIIYIASSLSLILYIFYHAIKEGRTGNENIEVNAYCLISDNNDNIMPLNNLNGKLIFFFSKYNCMPCVSKQLELINNATPYLDQDKLIILTDFTYKELEIFENANHITFKTYKTKDRLFKDKETKFNVPVYFTFSKKHEIDKLLICDDMSGNSTGYFLEQFYSW